KVPEGGVWALATDSAAAEALASYGGVGDATVGPTVLACPIEELPDLLALRGEAYVSFDAIVGRNVLAGHPDPSALLRAAWDLLAPGGRLSLAEALPLSGSRPSELLDPEALDAELMERVARAEGGATTGIGRAGVTRAFGGSAVVTGAVGGRSGADATGAHAGGDARVLDIESLERALEDAGLSGAKCEVHRGEVMLPVTGSLVERWFGADASYAAALGEELSTDELAAAERAFRALVGQPPRTWRTATAFVIVRRESDNSV
ncbi:MAG: hypothetical protein ACK2UL_06880, partial [Anaerolineae bacterium]